MKPEDSVLETIIKSLHFAYPSATVEDVYENSKTLLHRLLFLINIEDSSPDILEHPGYSLYALQPVYRSLSDNPDSYMGWHRLINLFRVLEEGSESVNISKCPDGVFVSETAPLIKDKPIMDDVVLKSVLGGLYGKIVGMLIWPVE